MPCAPFPPRAPVEPAPPVCAFPCLQVGREMLMRALTTHGEALSTDDLAQCLRALVGTADAGAVLPTQLDGQSFAEGVLGFEDYDGEQQPAE